MDVSVVRSSAFGTLACRLASPSTARHSARVGGGAKGASATWSLSSFLQNCVVLASLGAMQILCFSFHVSSRGSERVGAVSSEAYATCLASLSPSPGTLLHS